MLGTENLIVKEQGVIQHDLVLYGQATSPCMFNGGALAEPDEHGIFHVTCYPEILIGIWLGASNRQEGLYGNKEDVWYLDVDQFQDGQVYTIELNDLEKGTGHSKIYRHRN